MGRGPRAIAARWAHPALACCLVGLLSAACTTGSGPRGRPVPSSHARGAVSARSSASRPAVLPRGTRRWRLSHPALEHQIEGFTARSSGVPGALVALHVSTYAPAYHVTAYRIGAYPSGDGMRVWRSGRLAGTLQPGPDLVDPVRRTVVAPWRTSVLVDTAAWAPGLYVFKLVASTGWQAHVPYVVSSTSAAGRTALVFPVTTWQAYNNWGGYSLYEGPPGDRRSWAVSFDRPYPAPGATEMRFSAVPVVVTAERLDLPLAYLTDLDLDSRPDALAGASAYVSVGHDEYWSDAMRRRVEEARDAGTNLLFLGANTMYWKVRVEPERGAPGRVVVGYRTDSGEDPVPPDERTGLWRDGPGHRSENALTGMEYECFPVDAPFTVVAPRWWGFAGTGTHQGEAMPHLVGIEADRVYPVPSTPRPLQVLSDAHYSCRGAPTSAQASYYTTRSGAGVLDVGTLRWTCALADRCPADLSPRAVDFVRQVTATVLRDFARGPAGRRHPAHDNVSRFSLPRTNEVPAS